MAVRCSEPASGVIMGAVAQKFRWNVVSGTPGFWSARHHERIVIAGNGQNWRGIGAEWFVKLIVVVLRFAEIIDDIAEMIEERRPIIRIGLGAIDRDLIGNAKFIGVFTSVRGAQSPQQWKMIFPAFLILATISGP